MLHIHVRGTMVLQRNEQKSPEDGFSPRALLFMIIYS